jgi:hypothetical protein
MDFGLPEIRHRAQRQLRAAGKLAYPAACSPTRLV